MEFIKKIYNNIKWRMLDKEHPHDRLRWNNFIKDSLWLISIIFLFLVIYGNLDKLNTIILWFIKLGSVILIGLAYFIIKFAYRLIKNVYYCIRGQNNLIKLILILIFLSISFYIYQNQEKTVNSLIGYYERIDTKNINPFDVSSFEEVSTNVKESSNKIIENNQIIEDVLPPLDSVTDKTKDVEQYILLYTNIERKSFGVDELREDDYLFGVARKHSLDMAENDYFDHVNLQGRDPSERAGVPIGENIGMMPTGNIIGVGYVSSNAESIAKAQVQSWMQSPGHRSNILNRDYDSLGVGVAYDGLYYISTQDFGL